MTYSNRTGIQIRASRELDNIIREIARENGLTKRQASDFIAFNFRKIMKKERINEKELRFF